VFGGLHSSHPLPSAEALLEVARAFTPRVEALGPSPVLLDLHGLGRVWPDPASLGEALLVSARARAVDPHVALASTRSAALVLVRVQPGLTIVPPGQEAALLAPLPLAALALDDERAELLQRWGLRSLGDLARLPARGLAERFGPDGPRLRRLARGEDETPLVPSPAQERFEVTLDLEWPVDGLEPLSFLLGRILEPLCTRLLARGRRATGMELQLLLVDGSTHRRALRPAAATAEPRTWRTLLLLDLEAHPPHDAIRGLCVRAEPTPARTTQFSLLDPALPSPERLAETLGRLHEWTSAGKGGAASLLDTHRPGAFLLGSFSPGPLERRRGVVASPGPAPHLALRPFRPPLPAAVTLDSGAPRFVEAPGVRGAVLDRAGPWRASGDWWDVAWSREEWDVALAGGGLYRIYRDRLREQWFVEGELD
jgi:protein ImuB